MNGDLAKIAEIVQLETGIRYGDAQAGALEAALERVSPGLTAASFIEKIRDPLCGPRLLLALIEEITVKETFFMRDRGQLEQIPWRSLLEDARANGADKVRIWSVGCATGEEAYSLALLACEAFAPLPPPVTILATDISTEALEGACEGRYSRRSVAALQPHYLEKYFSREERQFVVSDQLRSLVFFARHNIVRDPVPPLGEPRFHLVLCRNVFIYFENDTIERVIGSLERALVKSGTLILGATDALSAARGRPIKVTKPTIFDRRAKPRPKSGEERPRPKPKREPGAPSPDRAAEQPVTLSSAIETAAYAERRLASNPLDATAYFLRGLVELDSGAVHLAITSLRRALYVNPHFSLAAFHLGRAFELLNEHRAARRSYEQTLRTLPLVTASSAEGLELLLGQVDLTDVAAAARARVTALSN